MEEMTFDEAIDISRHLTILPMKKGENKGYFAPARVDRGTIPEGWYAYDITRTGTGAFSTIEKGIAKDKHAGTFLTKTEFDFGKKKNKSLTCGYDLE